MADINLERKQKGGGMGWLWALLAILVIALIAWWLWPENEMQFDQPSGVDTLGTTGLQPPTSDGAGLAVITLDPSAWDRPFPTMERRGG